VLDKEKILIRLDELESYVKEIKQIVPGNIKEYRDVKTKRSLERLLQLSIECVVGICKAIVSGLRLGIPDEENDIFKKLYDNKVISEEMSNKLKQMKGFRNIIVHEYAEVDDELVFESITTRLEDFTVFKKQITEYLRK